LAERRLGDAEFARRTRDAARFDDAHEEVEAAGLHGGA
jgi:hypothetical protein